MYEPPIQLLIQQVETNMRQQHDKQIFEAIQKCGVDVDRDELIKALAYDRDQYDKGYADGRADAQRWISVEERLPKGNVLAVNDRGTMHIGHVEYYKNGGFKVCICKDYDSSISISNVTHWMPLPEPPKEE